MRINLDDWAQVRQEVFWTSCKFAVQEDHQEQIAVVKSWDDWLNKHLLNPTLSWAFMHFLKEPDNFQDYTAVQSCWDCYELSRDSKAGNDGWENTVTNYIRGCIEVYEDQDWQYESSRSLPQDKFL